MQWSSTSWNLYEDIYIYNDLLFRSVNTDTGVSVLWSASRLYYQPLPVCFLYRWLLNRRLVTYIITLPLWASEPIRKRFRCRRQTLSLSLNADKPTWTRCCRNSECINSAFLSAPYDKFSKTAFKTYQVQIIGPPFSSVSGRIRNTTHPNCSLCTLLPSKIQTFCSI